MSHQRVDCIWFEEGNMSKITSIAALCAACACGQDPLALRDAVKLALSRHQAIAAADAAVRAAGSRVQQARGGYLPKIQYSEVYTRSDNPVFVFSSLLTQHRFTEANFGIHTLNRPQTLSNFQSQLGLEQNVYDGGRTRQGVRAAELGRDLSAEQSRRAQMDVVAGVVRAYYDAVLTEQSLHTADEAVRSAQADVNRAKAVRQAGMSTDADVLSMEVHLAGVREKQIRRRADLNVARAALNDALGLPLDTAHRLSGALIPAPLPDEEVREYETAALEQRPEARQTRLAASLAETQTSAARASLLPEVFVRGVFEADRERFVTRGGANWLASVGLRWNLFNGYADRARIEEASFLLRRARADRQRMDSAVRLEVRRAWEDVRSAQVRIEVAQAAAAMAEESLRITRNRYEAGLGTVTDLLRNETALLEARTRHLAAVYDQRMSAVALALAAGALNADSEVLN
jgi:outer membrane protein TolC